MKAHIIGKRFGRLTVLREHGRYGRKVVWLCACDCGGQARAMTNELRREAVKSCGCFRREHSSTLHKTHGRSKTRVYKIWVGMRKRCQNPKSTRWQWYGGRGIKVCDRWESFDNFYADMGDPPSARHGIERKDNDGNYEPMNCVWATQKQQAANQRKQGKKPLCIYGHVKLPSGRCRECNRLRMQARRARAA